MTSSPLSAELFQRHATALRSLARGLLADEHAAEDVVQETWVAALEKPPQDDSQLAGWLRQVARRLASKRRRGESRLRRREREAAREEPEEHGVDSVAELTEQRHVLRRVVDAVLSLEEPYQSVVLLRFYEDLPPRVIAERRGVPVATVKSQLHRALAKLRERLDEDAGGKRERWACALAAITGWKPDVPVPLAPTSESAATAGALAGGIAMEWKIMVGVGASAAALFGFFGTDPVAPGSTPTLDPAQQGGALIAAGELESPKREDEPTPSARTPIEHGEEPEGDGVARAELPLGEHVYTLSGLLVDGEDQPLDGVRVFVGPPEHPLNHVLETDSTGAFVLSWNAHTPAMEVVFGLQRAGRAWSGLSRLRLRAGEERHLRMALPHYTAAVEGKLSKEKHHLMALDKSAAEGGEVISFLLTEPQNLFLEEHADTSVQLAQLQPGAYFRWPGQADWEEADTISALTNLVIYETSETIMAVDSTIATHTGELHFLPGVKVDPSADANAFSVEGFVRDAEGRPVIKALVTLKNAQGELQTRTGKDGSYRFSGLHGNRIALRAGGGRHGQAEAILDVPAGSSPVWDAVLHRGAEIQGRLLDAGGEPLAEWIVEVVTQTPEGSWHKGTQTDAAGRFALPNVEGTGAQLFISRHEGEVPFPVLVESGVVPGPAPIELVLPLDLMATRDLRLEVLDENGEPLERAEVRVWQEATGRARWLAYDSEAKAFLAPGLPLGRYSLTAGDPLRGWTDLGSFQIEAELEGDVRGPLDLGSVQLAAPAHLAWERSLSLEGLEAVEEARCNTCHVSGRLDDTWPGGMWPVDDDLMEGWTLLRHGAAVDSVAARGTSHAPFQGQLAAGRYTLYADGEEPVEFELVPGAELLLGSDG